MIFVKKAYAKINLTLEILGTKRGDGFHDIASVMHKVENLYDEVCVEITDDGIKLTCDKDVCEMTENIAYLAAKKYIKKHSQKCGKTFGVNIHIKKNIPQGAGLAGGSSDAACVLDLLSENVGVLTEEEVFDIALSIGSDVPFCLQKHKCALCTGRGEIIEDIPELVNAEIAVMSAKTPLSTKGIYGEYDSLYGDDYSKSNSLDMAEILRKRAPPQDIFPFMCNDFQALCEKRCPEIADNCKKLLDKGYFSQMSGSGSAVFGIKQKK